MKKIQIENLTKKFKEQKVLDSVTINFDISKFNCIKGSSGSGKSTILNILGSLDKDYEGDIYFNEVHYKSLNEAESNKFRNKELGFVFQSHFMVNSISILDNITLPLLISGEKNDDRVSELVKELNIEKTLKKLPLNCSGGEKQRAAIVRALINSPSLIIADEPTGNLDEENSIKVATLLKKLNLKYGVGIILATHDDKVAAFADNIYVIEKQKIKVEKKANDKLKKIF